MKKAWIMVLLVVLTAVGMSAASGEEDNRVIGVMDLYAIKGESPEWIGTGVPIYDGVLLASAAILPENTEMLVITDGVNFWNAEQAAPDHSGMLMTVIFDTSEATPVYTPFTTTSLRGIPDVTNLTVHSADEHLSRITRAVYSVQMITWRSTACLLAEISGPAELGSPMLAENGELVGIAVAEWAEGTNRMVFLTADSIFESLSESLNDMMGMAKIEPPEGFTVTMEGNVVQFDWSAMTLPEAGEGEKLYLVISDAMSNYLTYVPIENLTSYTLILTPGRTYYSGIMASAETPFLVPDEYATTTLPPAEKLTDYGFTSKVCSLALAPEEGLADGVLPEPVTEMTEELLRSGRVYYYSSTCYEVDQVIEGIPLLVTLTSPDGSNYRYTSSWIYDPSYMTEDTWAVSLDQGGLLEMLNQTGYPKGTYEMCMYIGDKLADSFTFDLK